jgi:hypothetical protein
MLAHAAPSPFHSISAHPSPTNACAPLSGDACRSIMSGAVVMVQMRKYEQKDWSALTSAPVPRATPLVLRSVELADTATGSILLEDGRCGAGAGRGSGAALGCMGSIHHRTLSCTHTLTHARTCTHTHSHTWHTLNTRAHFTRTHARTHARGTHFTRALYTHARTHFTRTHAQRSRALSSPPLHGRWLGLQWVCCRQLADLPDAELARLCMELLQWRALRAALACNGGPTATGRGPPPVSADGVAGLLATRAQCIQVSMAPWAAWHGISELARAFSLRSTRYLGLVSPRRNNRNNIMIYIIHNEIMIIGIAKRIGCRFCENWVWSGEKPPEKNARIDKVFFSFDAVWLFWAGRGPKPRTAP